MTTVDELRAVFERYREDYSGDEDSFVDFVVAQIVRPPGNGVEALIAFYRHKVGVHGARLVELVEPKCEVCGEPSYCMGRWCWAHCQ